MSVHAAATVRSHHSVAHARPRVRSRPSTSVGGFVRPFRGPAYQLRSVTRIGSHRRRRHRSRGRRRGPQGRARRRRGPRHGRLRPRRRPLPPRRRGPRPTRRVDEWRGLDALLLGAVGTPDVPPGVIERGLLLKMRFDLDLYINQRPFLAPRPGRHRLHRDPREHRGHLRRRGRLPAQGHAARGRHPGLGQHPHRRRALRPLRLRAGRRPAPQAPHARAQDQRAHLRRRPLAAHVRRGGRRVPRRRPPPTTTSTPPASTSSSARSATT